MLRRRWEIKPAREDVEKFQPGRFRRVAGRVLEFRLKRRYVLFLAIWAAFFAGCYYLDVKYRAMWARYYWPGVCAVIVAAGVLSLFFRRGRQQARLVAWTLMLFAGRPKQNEEHHLGTFAKRSPYGDAWARQSYLLWTHLLVLFCLIQLCFASVLVETPLVSDEKDYPAVGTTGFTRWLEPPVPLPIPRWAVMLVAAVLPPLTLFFSLVLLIGQRRVDGNTLWEADDALEHELEEFEVIEVDKQADVNAEASQ